MNMHISEILRKYYLKQPMPVVLVTGDSRIFIVTFNSHCSEWLFLCHKTSLSEATFTPNSLCPKPTNHILLLMDPHYVYPS